MPVMSTPSRQKSWQTHRERVSVMAALAIQKETVIRRLTELREQHGLSQERAAGRVGVTMRQWQRWESGKSLPYPRNLDAIAETFEFPVAEFFDQQDRDAATSISGARAELNELRSQQKKILKNQEEILRLLRHLTGPAVDARPLTDEDATVPDFPLEVDEPARGPRRRAG